MYPKGLIPNQLILDPLYQSICWTQVVARLSDVWQIETTRDVNAKSIDEAVRFAKIIARHTSRQPGWPGRTSAAWPLGRWNLVRISSSLLLLGKKCAKFYGATLA